MSPVIPTLFTLSARILVIAWTLPIVAAAPTAVNSQPCAAVQPTDLSSLDLTVKRSVRGVYFTPRDRPFRECLDRRLDTFIRMAQEFFEAEMSFNDHRDAWGSGKSFLFETDAAGRWKVVFMVGEQDAAWYQERSSGESQGTPALDEINRRMPADFPRDNVVFYIYAGRTSWISLPERSRKKRCILSPPNLEFTRRGIPAAVPGGKSGR